MCFKSMHMEQVYDLVIIGSGLAASALALKTPSHWRVAIVTKSQPMHSNSYWAQGGVAAVATQEDDFHSHIEDTWIAGAELGQRSVIEAVVTKAPQRMKELLDWGVPFDRELHLEGGHSHRRIYHVEDHTGRSIQETLWARLMELKHIELFTEHVFIDLILDKQIHPRRMGPSTAMGIYAWSKSRQEVIRLVSPRVVLATGGLGRIFKYTSNWTGATGDGIAAAFRAGARVANMEFVQFHPTLLYHKDRRNFLISEALRGEGGRLIDHKGEPFMHKYHPQGELAPRDIVSRAIAEELRRSAAPCVYLDMTHLGREELSQRFPHIYQHCAELGLFMEKDPIPVVPGAHYTCGGVLTDLNGRTDVTGLWVIGESACTGLHGANRLASNSLLECLVMAHECAQDIQKLESQGLGQLPPVPAWTYPQKPSAEERAIIHHLWDEIRSLMWNYAGIIRSNMGLERALQRLLLIQEEVKNYYRNDWIYEDLLELRNITLNARLVVWSALKRKESRGCHYNKDYPHTLPHAEESVIWPGEEFR